MTELRAAFQIGLHSSLGGIAKFSVGVDWFLFKWLQKRSFHPTVPRQADSCLPSRNKYPPQICFQGKDINALMDPTCKIAIIIDGGNDVAYSIADSLLKDCVETVVIASADGSGKPSAARLCQQHGFDKAVYMHANASCENHLNELFRETICEIGRPDIIITNPRNVTTADTYGKQQWEGEITVNLWRVIHTDTVKAHCSVAQNNAIRTNLTALKHLSKKDSQKPSNGSVVINCATMAGLTPVATAPAFSASHHGVVGATRSFGDEQSYAKSGIRVVGLLHDVGQSGRDSDAKGGSGAMAVGMAVAYLVRRGPTGTIWVLQDGQLSITEAPGPKIYKLVRKFV